jgi:hypothetical protein
MSFSAPASAISTRDLREFKTSVAPCTENDAVETWHAAANIKSSFNTDLTAVAHSNVK